MNNGGHITAGGGERVVFLDFLRVIACYMVILVHSCEFFYVGGVNIFSIKEGDGIWVSMIDSALRASVPLFVMTSSYLLLPLRDTPGVFYRKRFIRVFIPFIIWSVLYAVLPWFWGAMSAADVKTSLTTLLYNFNMSSGHLWFIYMLIGLYLFMPVISPWLAQVSKRFEQGFLILWFLTTFYPYVKLLVPDILGECFWNEFSTIWYFSGYIGYLVLAHYIRRYVDWTLRRSLIVGSLLFLAGYVVTFTVFNAKMLTAQTAGELEVSWRFCTFNVAMMSAGLFIIIKKIKCRKGMFLSIVQDISKLSYGMYLAHIFVLNFVFLLLSPWFSTPVTIVLVGTLTYILTYLLIKLLSLLPGSKYLVG